MLVMKPYDRVRAVTYAERWALGRNPLFVDYTGRGGNCTNFVSQCIYAGSCVMNYTPVFGWYHTLLVVGIDEDGELLLAAQSDDAYNRRLDSYTYESARFIHILGVRLSTPDTTDCYETLLAGEAIVTGE